MVRTLGQYVTLCGAPRLALTEFPRESVSRDLDIARDVYSIRPLSQASFLGTRPDR